MVVMLKVVDCHKVWNSYCEDDGEFLLLFVAIILLQFVRKIGYEAIFSSH